MQRFGRRLSSSSSMLPISTPERSYTQCQRNSVVASAASDTSLQRKSGRKVSKDERRSMVEAFVNKYRVMNSGKFPTVSHVRSGVGGSYYVVKKIVQELQYESQTPSTGMINNNPPDKKLKKQSEPSSVSVEDSSRQMTMGEEISVDSQIGTSLGNEEVRKHFNIVDQDNGPAEITKEVPVTEEGHKVISSTSKTSLNESEELTDSSYLPELGVELKDYQEESPQAVELTRDLKKDENGNKEAEKESFAWKHLKSFVDGIMRIWGKF